MAGSYGHVADDNGAFLGTRLLNNLGDAYEALEEMYGMIWLLAGGDAEKIKQAQANYLKGFDLAPPRRDDEDDFEDDDEDEDG